MNGLLKDLKFIDMATKSLKILSIARIALTVVIIVFGVLKGRNITQKIIEK